MNYTIDIETYRLNKTPNFIHLIEHIRQCIRKREITKEQQQRRHTKIYSILHYIENIKRCINDNPLIGHVLVQFYSIINNYSSQTNRFSSTIIFDNTESKISLEETASMDNFYTINPKSDLSKISLTNSRSTELNNLQSIKSTTHFIQPLHISHQTTGLMTKATLIAINKAPRQRTKHDIEILEHLLNNCDNLRYLPTNVRSYAARSLLFLTYHPNTILTRQNLPPFLVYIIVYGHCKLLLETQQTTIFGHQLNIGDVYGDDYRLNGLITNESTHCNLIVFFLRDIKAYENYLSDMMKQLLFEQLRLQSTFSSIQWKDNILNYFLKWSKYKQYSIDEIIYGNEEYEHNNHYFILYGQVSFVRLLEVPSRIFEHTWNDQKKDIIQISNSSKKINTMIKKKSDFQTMNKNSKLKTTWHFLNVFTLSDGHYFGFESTTNHAWYLTRSTVDIISIPKNRFKELGYFAPMIFNKLRQDYLDIYPNEDFIRDLYIKHIKTNENDMSTIKINNQKQRITINNLNKMNWIPEQNILSIKKKKKE
ncbi:unnamed protein product [Adineta steineri]|uniref:Cyclic nucleotide-binding domain-containing protein n=1 Tax=Adineta steineri TaxID=433720 RepID=A0A815DNM3_9BILA|nr:unnamed protein product [Adineta steineri]CAF3792730.1 unnamed protein product [Adineta steineri]